MENPPEAENTHSLPNPASDPGLLNRSCLCKLVIVLMLAASLLVAFMLLVGLLRGSMTMKNANAKEVSVTLPPPDRCYTDYECRMRCRGCYRGIGEVLGFCNWGPIPTCNCIFKDGAPVPDELQSCVYPAPPSF